MTKTKYTAIDYAEEGKKLLARVNLEEQQGEKPKRYSPADAIFKHPHTGANLYVGNYHAAQSLELLNALGNCRRIVFCQNADGTKYFEDNPEFKYLTFPIGRWRSQLQERKPGAALTFFKPLFTFLDEELGKGNSVLIHCLAGAHRAGTAGISSLMYLTGMTSTEATNAAQALRPAINPIGDFPTLLSLLDRGMEDARR